jgi:hypothetical protein
MRRVAPALALLLLCGCSATFREPNAPAGASHERWLHFFVAGAVGHAELDVRDFCKSGRAQRIRSGGDLLTSGVSILTLGIYTPRKVVVTCEKAQ